MTTPKSLADRAERCTWTMDLRGYSEDDVWEASCGASWQFMDGTPQENDCHFCHSCGGLLEFVTLTNPPEDDDD